MWERMSKLHFKNTLFSDVRIAAIGPATKKAIEERGPKVDIVPKEYVAESVVRSLKRKVKGKRVLLVRAKVARDVIPTELRKAGAHVDVVEAYETVVPQASRARLRAALANPKRRPHMVTFTSSSTVKNFVELLGGTGRGSDGLDRPSHFRHSARTGPARGYRGPAIHDSRIDQGHRRGRRGSNEIKSLEANHRKEWEAMRCSEVAF
jgi:uroporphyrinogen-III synthase